MTVPGKLKFWSSRGPTASVAGVLEVDEGVSCAAAIAGWISSPAAQIAIDKRQAPRILSPSLFVNRAK
ncbi:hypothetical protein GCM10022276_14860 [Sphingomonas limnosediminicola]|uniref:Uncharacterized protein n=1 Tax=Sphingomonas limnosediminicola TaxID=940133 RepID=A0ABP7LAY5_9SPHN